MSLVEKSAGDVNSTTCQQALELTPALSLTSLSLSDQDIATREGMVQFARFTAVVIGNQQTLLGRELDQHHLGEGQWTP